MLRATRMVDRPRWKFFSPAQRRHVLVHRLLVRMSVSSMSSDESTGPSTPPESVQGDDAWKMPHTFRTLDMQRRFMKPSKSGWDVPALREITRPHIESFNALWAEDPSVDAPGSADKLGMEGVGLLERSVQSLAPRVVFDNTGGEGSASRGNRLEMRIDAVSLSRPMVPDRAKDALDRRVYPDECRNRLVSVSYTHLTLPTICSV